MLEIIKTLFSRGDLNSVSLHTTANKLPRPLKVKIQWKQMALQRAGNAIPRNGCNAIAD
jgi:hypothetical protein